MVSQTATGTTGTDRRDAMGLPPAGMRVAYVKPVSWAAIFAGAMIAAATHILLTLLGIGVGLAVIDPASAAADGGGFGIGAAVWGVISAVVSLGLGGFVAGYIAGSWRLANGMMHGFMAWALATVFGVLLLTSSAAFLAGSGMSAMARAWDPPAAAGTFAPVEFGTADQAGTTGAAADNAGRGAGDTGGENGAARLSDSEARAAARAGSKAAFWSFGGMLLGAAAAGFGGRMGRDRAPLAPAEPSMN